MKTILKQRSFIMGLAILWVAWFHTEVVTGNRIIDFLRQTGYGGVDLFFLLTGVGAWFSLSKKPGAADYMKRRMARILPSYFPFIMGWLIWVKFTGELYGTEIIGNLTMMGWWHGGRNQFNWYVSAIWLFYLLAPVFVGLIQREKKWNTVFLMAVTFVISISFLHTNLLIAFSRLPLFVLGIGLGKFLMKSQQDKKQCENGDDKKNINEKKNVNEKSGKILLIFNLLMLLGIVLLFVSVEFLSGYLWNYGLWWYPFILISVGLAADMGILAEALSKNKVLKWIKKIVDELGKNSFEIFLFHIPVFQHAIAHWEMNGIKWFLLFVLMMATGVIYGNMIRFIQGMILKRK